MLSPLRIIVISLGNGQRAKNALSSEAICGYDVAYLPKGWQACTAESGHFTSGGNSVFIVANKSNVCTASSTNCFVCVSYRICTTLIRAIDWQRIIILVAWISRNDLIVSTH